MYEKFPDQFLRMYLHMADEDILKEASCQRMSIEAQRHSPHIFPKQNISKEKSLRPVGPEYKEKVKGSRTPPNVSRLKNATAVVPYRCRRFVAVLTAPARGCLMARPCLSVRPVTGMNVWVGRRDQ
jgi:hypothetical protein